MRQLTKTLFLLFGVIMLNTGLSFAQEDSVSRQLTTKFDEDMRVVAYDSISNKFSLIPNESIFDTIYVMINDEIPPIEANRLIAAAKREREAKDKIDFYNILLYRKLNNFITLLVEENNDSRFILMRERDIAESNTNKVRFVLRTDFSSKNFVNNETQFAFYMEDRLLYKKYQSTYVLEELFNKYKLCRNVFKPSDENFPTQSQVNKFAYLKDEKEKKQRGEMSQTGAWVLGGVIYAVVVVGINFIANL